MWKEYYSVTSIDEALQILAEGGEKARIIAGGTDLLLMMERGAKTGIETLIDVSRIKGQNKIVLDEDGRIHLGPLVTHSECMASKLVRECGLPLAQASREVGAPQIRNLGTVAGNLVSASPANDTITPLMALGARVTLRSMEGERILPLEDFFIHVNQTDLRPDEMLVDIAFPAMKPNQRGAFIKLALRRAQAISLVNAAVVLTFKGDVGISPIEDVAITLGAVAPTIIHAHSAEMYLQKRQLNEATIAHTAERAMGDAVPIDDVRSSADYRREMVRVCVSRLLTEIMDGSERNIGAGEPVTLASMAGRQKSQGLRASVKHTLDTPIHTRINGVEYVFESGQDKTLLRLLREEAGLTGTKEGCAEGECGACTVFLDGKAVMSCLVPAVRAHEAEIVTIEGIAKNGNLHPVQQAFVDAGAVQCGYCTPGFIMSAVALLEEVPTPSMEQIQTAISGNLCRCTGYYKIVEAIEQASQYGKNSPNN